MGSKFLDRTNYFRRPTTWLKRIAVIILFSSQILWWDFGSDYLQYLLIFLIISAIVILRKEDLAVDHNHFYYLQTSIIPSLSKTEKFEITKIKSIRGKAYQSWFWSIYGQRSLMGFCGVELTLSENQSASLATSIYKKDMDRIVYKVKRLMDEKRSLTSPSPNRAEK